ncbi:MAG: peptidoglycan-binding domain-containing protein [Bacillota bacterium]
MDLLKTVLLYLSMLFISSVQIAPDPSTVNVTPSPVPTPFGIVATATPVPTPSPTPVPTPKITPNLAYGQLNMGDREEAVMDMQRRLTELGYYTGEIDGAYGNQTRHAVEMFQYQNGLLVDGIAGRYTLTILYEYGEVKPLPTQAPATPTPAFHPDDTLTPPPATQTPEITPTATPAATPQPEPTETPDPNLPMLMDAYHFVLSGFAEPVTAKSTGLVLHPVEAEEALYVPLTEILHSAGNIIITNTEGSTEEIAFSVTTDLYQVSYTRSADSSLSGLSVTKNAQLQPLNTRNAILLDGIFYLPLEDMQRITGIGFTMDDAGGVITVTMPAV